MRVNKLNFPYNLTMQHQECLPNYPVYLPHIQWYLWKTSLDLISQVLDNKYAILQSEVKKHLLHSTVKWAAIWPSLYLWFTRSLLACMERGQWGSDLPQPIFWFISTQACRNASFLERGASKGPELGRCRYFWKYFLPEVRRLRNQMAFSSSFSHPAPLH